MSRARQSSAAIEPPWEGIPDAQWMVYHEVIQQASSLGIRFAFGGAFATAVYTGELRNTKDFDFYILPDDRDAMVRAITSAGLEDHFDQLAYDRSWIYRGSRDDVIVDVIWAMANHRAAVDQHWLERGETVLMRGVTLRPIPIEELIWSKLYVLQRERCDWTDVLNLMDAQVESIRWGWLLDRLGEDAPLLGGALSVYCWLAADRAHLIPSEIRRRLRVDPLEGPAGRDLVQSRANLLDSRPWFTRLLR
jgi:hypothetical protein